MSNYIFTFKSYYINHHFSLKVFDILNIVFIIEGEKKLFPKYWAMYIIANFKKYHRKNLQKLGCQRL